MRYLSFTCAWTVILVLFLLLNVVGRGVSRHDPRADFSFMIKGPLEVDHPSMMTLDQVYSVFRDHLDQDYPDSKVKKLSRHFIDLCRQHRLDPAFVLSLIHVESSFRVEVISSAGAVGLMQVMPPTGRMMARILGFPFQGMKTLKDPFMNLTLGTAYLARLRSKYKDLSPYYFVAAYNIGPGRLDELRARKNFKPKGTLKYYRKIKNGTRGWRQYGKDFSFYGPSRQVAPTLAKSS